MLFLLDIAYAFALFALAVGVVMIAWSLRNKGNGVGLVKTFGYIITIIAIFIMLCLGYYGLSYWSKGYFSSPAGMAMMQSKTMMQGGGMQGSGSMMKGMMKGPMHNNTNTQ